MPDETDVFRLTEIVVDTRRYEIYLHVGSLIESEAGRVESIADLIVIPDCWQAGKNTTRDEWIDAQSLASENIKLPRNAIIIDISKDALSC